MENSTKLLEDSLLVIWNDRDPQRRLEAMPDVYSPAIVFYESNEGQPFRGHEEINALIANLQGQWHPEFTFELTQPSRINHEVQQITWRLGIPGQPPVATGSDIAVTEAGKIKSLHLLLDGPEK